VGFKEFQNNLEEQTCHPKPYTENPRFPRYEISKKAGHP
jgi:hypothetical protein